MTDGNTKKIHMMWNLIDDSKRVEFDAAADELPALMRTNLETVWKIGDRLRTCKQILKYGQWLPFCKHLGIGDETARRYMACREVFDSPDQVPADWTLAMTYDRAAKLKRLAKDFEKEKVAAEADFDAEVKQAWAERDRATKKAEAARDKRIKDERRKRGLDNARAKFESLEGELVDFEAAADDDCQREIQDANQEAQAREQKARQAREDRVEAARRKIEAELAKDDPSRDGFDAQLSKLQRGLRKVLEAASDGERATAIQRVSETLDAYRKAAA